jgi:dipeptidyl aminopeptidase/acylaminoacyl peptidase
MRFVKCIAIILLLTYSFSALGQKKNIDQAACDHWPSLVQVDDGIIVSNDGKHIVYAFESQAGGRFTCLYSPGRQDTLKIKDASAPRITADNKWFVCISGQDDLLIKDLISERPPEIIREVSMFELGENEHAGDEFLIYQTGSDKKLVIRNLTKQTLSEKSDIQKYWFDSKKSLLVLQEKERLLIINLKNNHQSSIDNKDSIQQIIFGETANSVAVYFENDADKRIELINCQTGERKSLVRQSDSAMVRILKLSNEPLQFVNNDQLLLFKVNRSGAQRADQCDSMIASGNVNVWSYKDHDIQPKQLAAIKSPRPYAALVNCATSQILFVEDDELGLRTDCISRTSVILMSKVSNEEFYWNKDSIQLFVFDFKSKTRKKIISRGYPGITSICQDPTGNYLIWYDIQARKYGCYDRKKGTLRADISGSISGSLYKESRGEADKVSNRFTPYGIAGFQSGQPVLYVYSEFDIWRIDLTDIKEKVCLTNGYGELTKTKFRLCKDGRSFLKLGNDLVAWTFNNDTKQNGFSAVSPVASKNPRTLLMSNDTYYFEPTAPIVSENEGEDPSKFCIVKARNANVYFFRKMSYNSGPNLYMTGDFSKLIPVTKFDTEKQYNWLTSKLLRWNTPNGVICNGILHAPEQVDPNRKYPVILNYYERRSECLNVYRTPMLSGHNINIPWYVSNGYLILELDFYYETGKVAKNIIDITTSAVKELKKLPFVDTFHIGIQGQSFGGYETCVLFTGTDLFAAACEMAGPTNIITEYGSIKADGFPNLLSADIGQRNIGQGPWDDPGKFIENSPLFHIKNVNTPVLMIHNRGDRAIDFSHAIEMYMGLRRLGKKVWLLEYEQEGHAIYDYNNKLDYTIRMQQFFDHYLKGSPAPFWMTKGIHASVKEICNGLKLEKSGVIP